jgi:DNA-binding transcriptional LysR family regulator
LTEVNMDLLRLRTLHELSVRETMAEVAEALCITPSAVCQHIASLEASTGVQLTERSGRRVRLTQEGKRLALYAARAASVLDEASAEMAALKGQTAGDVRVAAFSSIAATLLPGTILALKASHPKVRPVLQELESDEGLAALRAWKVDVAIVDDLTVAAGQVDESLHVTRLTEDTLKVVLARDHPLAHRRSVSLGDLRDECWALDSASHAYSTFIVQACRAAGFEPVVSAFSSNLYVLLALIRSGCAIAVLPSLSVPRRSHEFRLVALQPRIARNVFVVCRAAGKKHPAVQAVMAELRRQVGLEAG